MQRGERYHIGLNAQLLALGQGYRSAGISTYLYHLLRHLPQQSDFRYTLWTGERAGELPGMERRISALPTQRPPVRILWEQALLPYALATVRPDLLHGMAFALPLLLPVPAVVTLFDLTFLHLPDAFRPGNRLYLRTISRLSAQRAAHVCTIAEHGKRDAVRHLGIPAEKVTVVYPGLNPRFAVPPSAQAVASFRAAKGLPARYLLYVGTLEPRKNVPQLVRAFAAIAPRFPDLSLVLAGGRGWGTEALEAALERAALGERLLRPGFVPEEELPLWYAGAELFVYPSQYEGFGLPPLEAMACGTPVITSRGSSLSEVVGEAGLTVEPGDEAALAEAIATLLADPGARAERAMRGPAQARRFQWSDSARRQAGVYHRVLQGMGPRA